MPSLTFANARIILPDRILDPGRLVVRGDRITAVGRHPTSDGIVIDLGGDYLAAGFVDLHVHGGDGHDFMDGTPEAFRAACQAHARHGTTSLLATTTVARKPRILAALEQCRHFRTQDTGGARVLGCHFYGPYFFPAARGAHPALGLTTPAEDDFADYLKFADVMTTATVAAELPGAEAFVQACRQAGVRCNVGHSHATFEQMEAAVGWGVRHVDHLFCAMSDKTKLRQTLLYPMRGGVLEAALYFDELTTEVIADGKHLDAGLLRLAYKAKGPDRLALVTDSSRALDMPDGEYEIGPRGEGERFLKQDGVGLIPDGTALASSVAGMDECVRLFSARTDVPLHLVVRMATLTPARIAGGDSEYGSLEPGKRADLVVLDAGLRVKQVYRDGVRIVGTH